MILDQREIDQRSLLRLKGIESGRPLIGPATVEFHLTDFCNLTCKYCWYYGLGITDRPTGKNYLPFEVFERTVKDCVDLKVDTIFLSGMGEPTFHPRFYDMLCRLENSFAVTIYSNGTFPIERCRDILRADRIVINLGEADRESYRALQGKDLFIKVLKNIKELAKLRPRINPDFHIEVVFIATRLNVDSLAKTEYLARRLGADIVRKKIAETNGQNEEIILSEGQGQEGSPRGWTPCFQGWLYSAIRLNGDVNVCGYMRRVTVGNIFKESFKSIWKSDACFHARTSVMEGNPFRNYRECINCDLVSRNKKIASQMETYNRVTSGTI